MRPVQPGRLSGRPTLRREAAEALRTAWMLVLFVLPIAPVAARTINFSCPVFSELRNSGDGSLPGDFVWELGAFSGNFTPTASNVADWKAHWTPAARSLTNVPFGFFSRDFVLASNAAPFHTGNNAWIWGYSMSSGPGEWVLVGAPGWKWPAADPLNPFVVAWSTANLTANATVGTLNATAGSPAIHIRTAAIPDPRPPAMTPETWRELYFETEIQNEAPGTALTDDFEGDGRSNLLEFALGSSARVSETGAGSGLSLGFGLFSGNLHSVVSVPRNPAANVTFTIQRSGNLTGWTGDGILTVTDLPTLFQARESAPQTPGTPMRSFFRLRVEP